MSTENQNSKNTITIAIITMVGVLGGAVFANWDKIFRPSIPTPSPSIATPAPEPSSSAQKVCIGAVFRQFSQFYFDNPQPPLSNVGVIVSVIPGGPAQVAGLREGDIILSVNGRPIASRLAIQEAIANLKPGDTAYISAARPSSFSIVNDRVHASGPITSGNVEATLKQCSM